ncbi:MAG TPA: DNA polymerase IV [Nocardioidaceae bacterium]|nr:DNA polymerase IV [Nocardioidaceae bacterium]
MGETASPTQHAWVLHVDLDQFIAAVEVMRRPELAGLPIVVGGRGDPTERGVVSTASYEAREFGVRSGMPLRTAMKRLEKAPDAVFVAVDKDAYDDASAEVMEALRSFGLPVEVLGWDEAFMAVETDDPEAFARRVQEGVLDTTGLHCSIGIGDTKVRAKIATDFGKPRGTFRLTEENWYDVMGDRPTDALWGIGSKTAKRLGTLGITTVRQLAETPAQLLADAIGPTMGPWYRRLGRGADTSPVDPTPYVARGRSREVTFQQNLDDWAQIAAEARTIALAVADDLHGYGRPATRLTLKVRYAPFDTRTKSRKLPAATSEPEEIATVIATLVESLDHDRAVRLLGVRAEMQDPTTSTP